MTAWVWAAALLGGACAVGAPDPVVSADEIVVGRARTDESVWLLTREERLIRVSVPAGEVEATAVRGLRRGEVLWGLARTAEGRLVTMLGPSTLAEIAPTGRLGQRWRLDRQYLGLHDAPDGLLLQPATFQEGSQLLTWTDRPDGRRRASGTLELTWFGSRAETLARNLVGCGLTRTGDVPCWFSHDARVHRVPVAAPGGIVELGDEWNEGRGRGRRPLEEGGPVVDAQVASDQGLWVLLRYSRGRNPTLLRVAVGGAQAARRLDFDARLILEAGRSQAVLLSRKGCRVEVGVP